MKKETIEDFTDAAVVLVEPSGKRNIGAAARAMKNTGFSELVLVAPPDGFRCQETYAMAPGSHDILDGARSFESLADALAGRHLVFGFTARHRAKKKRLLPKEAAEIFSRRPADARAALVFGPEDRGLTDGDISLCGHLVGIPTHPSFSSLNLAQAVLLACHTFLTAGGPPPSLKEGRNKRRLSPIEEKARIEKAAADLLAAAGYLTAPRKRGIEGTIKRIVYGSDIERRDTRNVLAAIRHLRRLLGGGKGPEERETAPRSGSREEGPSPGDRYFPRST